MVQAYVDHFVTCQKRMRTTSTTDESRVKTTQKSTTHITNTITMVVEPPTPAAAWI